MLPKSWPRNFPVTWTIHSCFPWLMSFVISVLHSLGSRSLTNPGSVSLQRPRNTSTAVGKRWMQRTDVGRCWKNVGKGKDENPVDLEVYCFQLETWVRDISKIEALSCFTLGKIIQGWQKSYLQSHWMISRFAGHGLVSADQHSWPSLGFVLWWVWC